MAECQFFIDQDNRILFWPTKRAPGYVVDEDTVLEVHELKANHEEHPKYIAAFAVLLFALFVASDYVYETFPVIQCYISENNLIPWVALIVFLAITVLEYPYEKWIGKPRQERLIRERLAHLPQIHEDRPPAPNLKFSACNTKAHFYVSIMFSTLAGGGLSAYGVITSIHPLDAVPSMAFGLVFVALTIFIVVREWTGLKKSDIRFYESKDGSPLHQRTMPSHNR